MIRLGLISRSLDSWNGGKDHSKSCNGHCQMHQINGSSEAENDTQLDQPSRNSDKVAAAHTTGIPPSANARLGPPSGPWRRSSAVEYWGVRWEKIEIKMTY